MLQEVDFILVGGGTADCVLAGRLTEDPGFSLCVLEAGKPDNDWRI
jgi:choline dehydrogenase-like flavoprotein